MNNIYQYIINNRNNDSLAFEDNMVSISYKSLYEETLKLASYIKSREIVNEYIIVPCNRNVKSIVSFLSIACSGNAFIPVDENASMDYYQKIAFVSNAKYFINTGVTTIDGLEEINYNDGTNFTNFLDISYIEKDWNIENDLCVIFTSGSTGIPKGVVKTHRNFIAFVNNFLDTFASFPSKPLLANQAPLFFDASMKDIFLTIATGGTLFFPDKTLFVMVNDLVKYLNDKQINVLFWVPSALSILAKTKVLDFVKPLYLKHVFFVGEVFPIKYLNYWIDKLPEVNYYNIYGSTELAGICLYYKVPHKIEDSCSYIPLGKPINNNYIKIINEEVVVISDQIGKGYLNLPEVNEKVFKIDKGIKELHTGDYGFLDDENNIVFVSRKDFQIKHMGYRIELQAIDNYIITLNYIESCCTLFDSNKDKIVCFVTLRPDYEVSIPVIIKDCKYIMPFYYIPNKIMILDNMPLNKNGKIDRNKLKENL